MAIGTSRKLIENFVASVVMHFASAGIVLLVAPVAISKLGLELYGLWALLNTLTRYSLLADFGIGPSVARHVAQFAPTNQHEQMRSVNTIGALFYLIVSIPIIALIFYLGPLLLRNVRISENILHPEQLLMLFFGASVFNLICWMGQSASITGLGLYKTTSAINAFASVCYAITAITMLNLNYGLQGLIWASYVQFFISAIIGHIVLIKHIGFPYINPLKISHELFKKVLKFGAWFQIGTVANLIIYDSPAIIVSILLGVEYVGLLDLGARLARVLRAVAFNFNNALLPNISSRLEESGADSIGRFLPQSMRISGLISLTLTGLLIAGLPLLVSIWLGKDYLLTYQLYTVIALLSITYEIEILISVPSTTVSGLGMPWFDACYSSAYAACSLALIIPLTKTMGFYGVLLSGLIGVTVGAACFLQACNSKLHFPIASYFNPWLYKASSAALLSVLPIYFLNRLVASTIANKYALVLCVVAYSASYCAIFIAFLLAFRFFTKAELKELQLRLQNTINSVRSVALSK